MKFKKIKTYVLLALATISLMACSNDDTDSLQQSGIPDTPENVDKNAVNIVTRAEGVTNNNSGMQAGLYMVNYINGQASQLLPTDNHVNNLKMGNSNNAWVPATPIYWQDTNVSADFYAYAPYQAVVADARAMTFSVEADQTAEDAFLRSDLLWGAAKGKSPFDGSFDLTISHQLSQVTVEVVAGSGFEANELNSNNVAVTLNGSRTMGTVDLQTGTVNATGEKADIKCHNNGDMTYTAILLPQTISFSNFVQIDWNGNKYTLQMSIKLDQSRHHKLTITLKKTMSGLDIGITGWDVIDEDFGGTVG